MKELEVIYKRFALLYKGNIQEGRKQWSNYRKVAECLNIEQRKSSAAYLKASLRDPYFA